MACVYCPKPEYPSEAQEMKQQGTVVLRVTIDANGNVSDVAIKQSSGHVLLDQAALRTVRRWKVEPDRTAGVPVGAEAEQVIDFKLK
jgi:protein TonB